MASVPVKIALPKEITLDVLRRDLVLYCNINKVTQRDLAYDIGAYPPDISHFLAGRISMPVRRVLKLVNLLYF